MEAPHGPGAAGLDNSPTVVAVENDSHHMVVVVGDNFLQTVVGNCSPHIAVEDSHIVVAVGDSLH